MLEAALRTEVASHQRQEQLSNAASYQPQQELPDGEKMAAAEKRRIRKLSMSMDPNDTTDLVGGLDSPRTSVLAPAGPPHNVGTDA